MSMPRTCGECRYVERTDPGRGRCGLAKEHWGGDVVVELRRPACRGFESAKPPRFKLTRLLRENGDAEKWILDEKNGVLALKVKENAG